MFTTGLNGFTAELNVFRHHCVTTVTSSGVLQSLGQCMAQVYNGYASSLLQDTFPVAGLGALDVQSYLFLLQQDAHSKEVCQGPGA